MNCLIDVLIIEDSEHDAELVLEELKQNRYAPVFKRVATRHDFLAALKHRIWDVIICDYVLPQFSGPEALKLMQSEGYDIPFIMVSGVFGEEEAVEMMKSSADDYDFEGNLTRLCCRH